MKAGYRKPQVFSHIDPTSLQIYNSINEAAAILGNQVSANHLNDKLIEAAIKSDSETWSEMVTRASMPRYRIIGEGYLDGLNGISQGLLVVVGYNIETKFPLIEIPGERPTVHRNGDTDAIQVELLENRKANNTAALLKKNNYTGKFLIWPNINTIGRISGYPRRERLEDLVKFNHTEIVPK